MKKSTAAVEDHDLLDLRLLALLEVDGRVSHARLARQLGRSRSAIQERIARLEKMGHIRGYTIRRSGPTSALRAYVLVGCPASGHYELAAALDRFPEVRVCDSITGSMDLALQVEALDMSRLERVLATIEQLPRVSRAVTFMVIQNRIDRRSS